MNRCLLFILFGLILLPLLPAPGLGQQTSSPVRAHVTLTDGSVVSGTIVSESTSTLVLDTSMGRLEIDRARVRSIVYGDEATPPPAPAQDTATGGRRSDPDYNSLILVPTAETLPKGDLYYRNFELLFNNLGYAVTDQFNISVMAAFPVTSDLRIVSIGAKYRLLSRETDKIGLAASGSAWLVDDETLATLSGIVSFGDRERSITIAANYGMAEETGSFFFFLGGDVQVGNGFKLLMEYGNSAEALTDDDFNGVLNLGFRLFWESVSFSLSAVRPIEDTGDDFIAFPLAVFSAHF